jgi:hypothetical protein
MEARMNPRSDTHQHCLAFSLSVSPRCRVFSYRDHLGNNVHHFDIPGEHNQLVIVGEAVVEAQVLPDVPAFLAPDAWDALDKMVEQGDYWEMMLPSTFAVETPALIQLAKQMGVVRRDDPLMLVQELNQELFDYFDYEPRSTRVDSPIDEAILSGKGVCQDFAHTMIPGISIADARTTTARRRTRRTRGSTCCCRTLGGWGSIRRTTLSRITGTFARRWGATMLTFRQRMGSFGARRLANCMLLCTWRLARSRLPWTARCPYQKTGAFWWRRRSNLPSL